MFFRKCTGCKAAPGYIMRQRQACEPMTMTWNKGILTAVVTGTLSLAVCPVDDE